MSKIYKPPCPLSQVSESRTIFLAGSIEQGAAMEWQKYVELILDDVRDLAILNPRRDEWDETWVQSISNTNFREQVEWELEGIKKADHVCFCFDPDTKAPVTLLELGICTCKDPTTIHVYCPNGYWRKGNVDVVCEQYGFNKLHTLPDLRKVFD
jgi:hypothetical protein